MDQGEHVCARSFDSDPMESALPADVVEGFAADFKWTSMDDEDTQQLSDTSQSEHKE